MKKNTKSKVYKVEQPKNIELNESQVDYENVNQINSNYLKIEKSYNYNQFLKVVNKSPFNVAKWADILFISERTLQRYAKANTSFSGLVVERILLLEKLIDFGNSFLGDNFLNWLSSPSFAFNGNKPEDYLYTYNDIMKIYNVIGRLQHGVAL